MKTRACKIVATLGPASDSPAQLTRLIQTGVDVVRVNFSHGAADDQRRRIARVREVEAALGVHVPILADLQGPKIRVGAMSDGGRDFRFGQEFTLRAGAASDDADVVPMPHPEILAVLEPGDELKFDDGRLIATITELTPHGPRAKMETPGRLTDRKGVSIPGRAVPIPALTEKDLADLDVALDAGVDYVALSFVQRAADVAEARERIGDRARIVSKIEKPSALTDIEEIVKWSDAIMVARGDLGVELAYEQVPIAQRRIIRAARAAGKPVIVATHMLQSMVEEAAPTRAEATDIAAAVYQGADAVMLSAETAVGRHPLSAVAVMDRVIRAIEADIRDSDGTGGRMSAPPHAASTKLESTAFGDALATLVERLPCAAVLAFTESGATGFAVAQARPVSPILVVTPYVETARRVMLGWGVEAVVMGEVTDFEDLLAKADAAARAKGVGLGERVVLAAGLPIGVPGNTNLVHAFRVGQGVARA